MKSTALYRHFDADGFLLYVGISDNPLKRLTEHEAVSPWFRKIANITIEWHDSRAKARLEEYRAIKEEFPMHNVQHAGEPAHPVCDIIQSFGGLSAFGLIMGVDKATVNNWYRRKKLPARLDVKLIKVAKEHDVPLTHEDLATIRHNDALHPQ